MNDLVDSMQKYYAERAPEYDTSMGYDRTRTLIDLQPAADHLCQLMQRRRVYEIACGPGFWTSVVCATAESILATDINESTLAQARLKPLDWSRVTLAVADAYKPLLLNHDFDGVLAVDWFAHVPLSRMDGFVSSLVSRVHAGTQIVFCDQLPKAGSVTGDYDGEGNHLQKRRLADGSCYKVIKHYFDDDQLFALLGKHARDLSVERFRDCRRIVVSFKT